MAYLGEKQQSETIRFHLTLESLPTGTPTVAVEKQGASILAATNMTQGATTLEWYYDYTTGAAATIGAYQVKYSAVIDSVTRYAYDQYDISVYDVDDVKADTETIISNLNISAGARAIVFNIKDGSSNPVEGVNVSVHNSNNDDTPIFGQLVTDNLGDTNTINLDDATYKVRLTKAAAIISEVETAVVTQSETKNLTVVATSITPPASADMCKLVIFATNIENEDLSTLDITVTTKENRTITANDVFVTVTESSFTLDTVTSPDNFFVEVIRGIEVTVRCDACGVNYAFTVPDQDIYNISALFA